MTGLVQAERRHNAASAALDSFNRGVDAAVAACIAALPRDHGMSQQELKDLGASLREVIREGAWDRVSDLERDAEAASQQHAYACLFDDWASRSYLWELYI